MLLKIEWNNVEIKEEIRKYFEVNENVNVTFQNLWMWQRQFYEESL